MFSLYIFFFLLYNETMEKAWTLPACCRDGPLSPVHMGRMSGSISWFNRNQVTFCPCVLQPVWQKLVVRPASVEGAWPIMVCWPAPGSGRGGICADPLTCENTTHIPVDIQSYTLSSASKPNESSDFEPLEPFWLFVKLYWNKTVFGLLSSGVLLQFFFSTVVHYRPREPWRSSVVPI